MARPTWTLFGAGYFIHDIIDAIESRDGRIARIVLNVPLEQKILDILPAGVEVVALADFAPSTDHYFYGFMEQSKEPLLQQLGARGIRLANIVHSFSHVAKSVRLGEGNFIGAGAVVGPNGTLGRCNIVNRNASVGHDARIGDFNNIGPGSAIAGLCTFGDHNFLGSHATVLPKLTLKNHITLGAGGVLTKSADQPGTYVGIPAKLVGSAS
jgi:sugar O-acyltransferase (sialic acid O-acetyltransferase NeuD family)